MKRIIGIEWSKISTYGFFRTIIILHFSLFLLVTFIFTRIDIAAPGFTPKNLFVFPNIWSTFAWVASWFNMLLAIMVIVLTGNEFANKTFRQQVLSGLSRNDFLFGKGFLVLGIAIYSFLLVFLTSMLYGFIYTDAFHLSMFFEKFHIILIYMLQSIGYMVFGIMVAVFFRNVSLSIILFLLYFLVMEPIIRLFLPKVISPWFPVKIISHLTPMPEFLKLTTSTNGNNPDMTFEKLGILPPQLPEYVNLLMALVYITIFIIVIFRLIRRKDI